MPFVQYRNSKGCYWKFRQTSTIVANVLFLLPVLIFPLNGCAPIRKSVSAQDDAEPLLITYPERMWDNQTRLAFSALSRDAFFSLQSETIIESPLMDSQQKRIKWIERKNKGKRPAVLPKGIVNLNYTNDNQSFTDSVKHQGNCKAHPFRQRIRIQGCITKIVKNKFCRGTCSSYFVPKLRPRKLKLRSHFRSCSACTPIDYDVIDVKLDCPFLNAKYIVRKVYKIKKCACVSVAVPNAIELSNVSLFNE